MNVETNQVTRIIRIKELISIVGLSRATIYNRMDRRSTRYDPDFPKKVSLGGNSVGWIKEEVEEWLSLCANKRGNC